MADAVRGKSRAVLIFPANFSVSLQDRMRESRHASDYTVMSSQIEVHMDDTGEYFLMLCSVVCVLFYFVLNRSIVRK